MSTGDHTTEEACVVRAAEEDPEETVEVEEEDDYYFEELDVEMELSDGESYFADLQQHSFTWRKPFSWCRCCCCCGSRRRAIPTDAPKTTTTTTTTTTTQWWRWLDPFQAAVTKPETASTWSLALATLTLLCIAAFCTLSVLAYIRAPVLLNSTVDLMAALSLPQARQYTKFSFTCTGVEVCLVGRVSAWNQVISALCKESTLENCFLVLRKGHSIDWNFADAPIFVAGEGGLDLWEFVSNTTTTHLAHTQVSVDETKKGMIGVLSSPSLAAPFEVFLHERPRPEERMFLLSVRIPLNGAPQTQFDRINKYILRSSTTFPPYLLLSHPAPDGGVGQLFHYQLLGPVVSMHYMYIMSEEYVVTSIFQLLGELGGISVGLWFAAAFLSYFLKRIFPKSMLSETALDVRGRFRLARKH